MDILEQLNLKKRTAKAYYFGQIISVAVSWVRVRVDSGLEVSIYIGNDSYMLGDRVILGSDGTSLSNLFVLKTIDKNNSNLLNYTVALNTD